MKLFNASVIFSALLSVGATCTGSKCNVPPNAINPRSGDAPPAPSAGDSSPKEKGINCELLLRQNVVNCSGLSAKTCDLISWLYAGCKKQSECGQKSGTEAKKCCDNAERLPFGAGVYYTGYMRACAPQYRLKRFDRPEFIDRPCSADYGCTDGLSKGLCDMRSWENAGCQQRAECDAIIKNVSELPECCKQWPRQPQGAFSQLFQSRFDLKCLAK